MLYNVPLIGREGTLFYKKLRAQVKIIECMWVTWKNKAYPYLRTRSRNIHNGPWPLFSGPWSQVKKVEQERKGTGIEGLP